MSAVQQDVWSSGDLYEPYVGRWSRLVGDAFVDWLAQPPGLRWLDVGCGTGSLSQALLDRTRPRTVDAIDPSEGFVAYASERLADRAFAPQVADAEWLPFDDSTFDAVASGLVLNFVPDPKLALREMLRVLKRGGTAAVYVWDYSGRMELMRYFWDAATDLDEGATELDEGVRFTICRRRALSAAFRAAGFTDVKTTAIDISTIFRDFDDYWEPFLGGQGPAPAYCVSLTENARAQLRELLRTRLKVQADGTIRLVARALAVRGDAPS